MKFRIPLTPTDRFTRLIMIFQYPLVAGIGKIVIPPYIIAFKKGPPGEKVISKGERDIYLTDLDILNRDNFIKSLNN